jgi:hypothetical protein
VILIIAVLVGLTAGSIRAYLGGRSYQPARLQHIWLVILAFIPQILAFYLPITRVIITGWMVSACLVSSLTGLLVFVWLNRQHKELWVAGLGLVANLVVIAANGGLMPISLATAAALYPAAGLGANLLGGRLGWSKNIVLAKESVHLGFLSDCLLVPDWIPWKYALSIGDVLLAAGVLWLLWKGGARREAE